MYLLTGKVNKNEIGHVKLIEDYELQLKKWRKEMQRKNNCNATRIAMQK